MRLLMAIFALTPALSWAQQAPVSFSDFSPALKLESVAPDGSIAKFAGPVTVTGTIYFEFDEGDSGRMDGVNFAKFVPDKASRASLPAITGGYFPSPVQYVLLEPAEAALEGAYGVTEARRLAHGTAHHALTHVRVVMRNYTATVECDARRYMSTDPVVTPIPGPTIAGLVNSSSGC